MMRLWILGAGTAIPIPGYSPAGYLVQIGKLSLLVDIGPGTLSRMAEAGFDYRLLETILVTHHHSDHTLDLVTLLQAYDSTPGWTRKDPLLLIGGSGTSKFYEQLMSAFPGIAPSSYQLELREIENESLVFPLWKLKAALTGHTSNSLGYRIEADGKSIAFSGDAVLGSGLVKLADRADVFVCECSFPGSTSPSNHLAAEQVGYIAHQAGVKRLLLVHLYPPAREADVISQVRREFAGPVEIAFDGLELSI